MRVAVTGASGLIGSALKPALAAAGHDVVPLVRTAIAEPDAVRWDPEHGVLDANALRDIDAVVHLAGETIGKRWTKRRKEAILSSRVGSTHLLAQTIASLSDGPRILVCASAIGYYGDRGDEELTEAAEQGAGYLAGVVASWEMAAMPAVEAGIRVCHLRTGLVLARHGGVLQRLLLPTRLCLGGPVDNGRQWWSWVTLDDVVAAYVYAVEHELESAYNLTAPNPVRNKDFMKALGGILHRPTVVPLPAFAVRGAFGQMGRELLLAGQRVRAARLEAADFRFAHAELDEALAHVLGKG